MLRKIDFSTAVLSLESRLYTDLPSLKFALQLKDRAEYRQEGSFLAITFSPRMILYDAADYGYARAIHLLSGATAERLLPYMEELSPGKHILKSSSPLESMIPEFFSPLSKASFRSYTAPPGCTGKLSSSLSVRPRCPDGFDELLHAVHYKRDDIDALLKGAGQFLFIKRDEEPAACCVIYRNYGEIWEIGALSVAPALRRQGLGKEIVNHAIALLSGENRFIRYQMNEKNTPSRELAEAVGLTPFMMYHHTEITISERRKG